MIVRRWAWLSVGLLALVALPIHRCADAEEGRPRSDVSLFADVKTAPPPDLSFLDALAKDLGLTLSGGADAGLVLPLAPQWALGGLRPYAALSPRVLKWVGEGLSGMAAPERESETDLSRGVGVGVGLQWKLSDHLDLFGEYMLRRTPNTGSTQTTPTLKPDAQSPGLKGGFSIRF